MNAKAPVFRVPKGPRVIFGVLAWGNTTLSVAKHYGFVEATTKMRLVGRAMGVVILAFGFFLQKLHARSASPDNSPKAAADRLFGRTLIGAGLADVALFASGSLAQARLVSSIIGIGVLLALAAMWSWRLRNKFLEYKRMLLGAYAYITATACAAFLFDNRTWLGGLAPWMIVVFWLMYIAGSSTAIDQRSQLVKA